jgi:hypothetical protein
VSESEKLEIERTISQLSNRYVPQDNVVKIKNLQARKNKHAVIPFKYIDTLKGNHNL